MSFVQRTIKDPAGRVGTPADIAKACFYFTDPDNDFVTGPIWLWMAA